MRNDDLTSERALMTLMSAGSMSQAVCVAAELGIADLLSDGPKSADTLARATHSHAPSLRRLLRALTTLGLCTETEEGLFAITEIGARLRADSDASLRAWTLWCGQYMWPVWGKLSYSVKSGESARKLFTGTSGFGHLERDEDIAALFNSAMAELSRLVARDLVAVYDFSALSRIVDVGGGYGTLLIAILAANPRARGVVFDRPHAMAGGQAQLAEKNLGCRCEMMAGDFFESVPPGADAYLMKSILHDWDDANAVTILRNCRLAIPPHGRLLIVEQIIPARFEGTASHRAIARADLNMLVALGGRERTEPEYVALLEQSGFAAVSIIAVGLEYSMIEAVPV